MMAVHKCQCVSVKRRDRTDTFVQRNETMPWLNGWPKQLQWIGIGRSHLIHTIQITPKYEIYKSQLINLVQIIITYLNWFDAQLNASPTIAVVRNFHQRRTFPVHCNIVASIRHAQWLLFAASRLRISRPSANVEHYGTYLSDSNL